MAAANLNDVEGMLSHDLAIKTSWAKQYTILKSASKVIGIMRKLEYAFSRIALNQIYISYVRPLLEY